MAKSTRKPPVMGNSLAAEIRGLKKLLGGLVAVGVVGGGGTTLYREVYAPSEVTAINSLKAEMVRMNEERIVAVDKATAELRSQTKAVADELEESRAKLWDRTTALDGRIDANASAIAALIVVQENTTKNLDRIAETVDKVNDKHESRIHDLEMRKTP